VSWKQKSGESERGRASRERESERISGSACWMDKAERTFHSVAAYVAAVLIAASAVARSAQQMRLNFCNRLHRWRAVDSRYNSRQPLHTKNTKIAL
jgi:hypothetical protein